MNSQRTSASRQPAGLALVVEDEPVLANAMVQYLRELGFSARHAPTLGEARIQLSASRVDVLVLDLTLPDAFADELLRELATSPTAPATVLVSGFSLAPLVARRHDLPLLKKPFDLEELGDWIAAARRDERRPRLSAEN